jgi:hypothetical protein
MRETGTPWVVMGGAAGAGELGPGLGRLYFVVGAFDGLHRGHSYLLARLRAAAAQHRARPAVITFDHHPDEILVGTAPPILCDPLERLVRFGHAGIDVVIIQHFDAAVRMTPYRDFVGVIAERVELAGFLMTPDAAFGYERRGTPAALIELGRSLGFEVSVVEPLEIDGRPVRSTEIRTDIAAGRLVPARRLLGRSLAVVGRVERGQASQGSRGPGLSGSGPGGAGQGGAGFSGGGGQGGAGFPGGAGQGGAGFPGGGGPSSVEFDLPVALPPAGRYRVDLEAAWAPDQPRPSSPVGAIAQVGPAGEVELELRGRTGLPPADRLRIRFIAPVT